MNKGLVAGRLAAIFVGSLFIVHEAVSAIPVGEHWQDGPSAGVFEIGGTLTMISQAWQWRTSQVDGLTSRSQDMIPTDKGMVYDYTSKGVFPVLQGYPLTTLPELPSHLQVSLVLADVDETNPRIMVSGTLKDGRQRQGEATFNVRKIALKLSQSSGSEELKWKVLQSDKTGKTTPSERTDLERLIQQSEINDAIAKDNVMNNLMSENMVMLMFAEDIKVRFPGAEEPILRWQGKLTPVVAHI